MNRKRTMADKCIDIIIYIILILLSIITLMPFMQVITISLSPTEIASKYGLHLFPTKITLEGYKEILGHKLIWHSYLNTFIRVITGTLLSLFLLIIGAYPLSKKYLPNRKLWTLFIFFTMYFQGGLIPNYLLINKLGITNTIFALILPSAVNAFTLIVVRNFFMMIPESVEESARIDGANDIYILFKIIVPLSKPVLATVALWSAVYHWNAWFDCMIYIQDESKFVLQYVLRQILIEGQVETLESTSNISVNTDTMKMAALVVSIVPIMCTYPFLQKYFVKGVMIGSVKG